MDKGQVRPTCPSSVAPRRGRSKKVKQAQARVEQWTREVLEKTESLQTDAESVRTTIEEHRGRGEHMREVLSRMRARREGADG